MNFEFSNPIRANELFRPILQEITFDENINLEKLKINVIKNINKFSRDKYKLKNDIDLTDQINNKIEESLNLLFMNNLIIKKNNFYSLSEKTKIHIQSMDPIKINGFSGNIEFIMDFLP